MRYIEIKLSDIVTRTSNGDIIIQICYPCSKGHGAQSTVCSFCLRPLKRYVICKNTPSRIIIPIVDWSEIQAEGDHEILQSP